MDVQPGQVRRVVDDHDVVFQHRWSGDVSGHQSVLWSVVVGSDDGGVRQFGYKLLDDSFAYQFVFDPAGDPMQTTYAPNADLDPGGRLDVRFPVESLPSLRPGLHSTWTITVDGEDACVVDVDG